MTPTDALTDAELAAFKSRYVFPWGGEERNLLWQEIARLNATIAQRDAALAVALAALEEAEAILGGEYGDHYGVLCEYMCKLRINLPQTALDLLARLRAAQDERDGAIKLRQSDTATWQILLADALARAEAAEAKALPAGCVLACENHMHWECAQHDGNMLKCRHEPCPLKPSTPTQVEK